MCQAHSARASPPATPASSRPQPRWKRRLLAAGIVLAVLALCHAPLLRGLAGLLVVDDSLVPTDAVVVMGSNGANANFPLDEIAQLYKDKMVSQVVLIEDRSSRLIQAGILAPLETVLRRELGARAVPEDRLTTRAGEYLTGWDAARALGHWLQEHPDTRVTLLCGQFDGRCSALIVRSVLDPQTAARVHWRAVPDSRFDVTNWWRKRHGIIRVLGAHVTLLHTWIMGEPPRPAKPWDPDRFENNLREQSIP